MRETRTRKEMREVVIDNERWVICDWCGVEQLSTDPAGVKGWWAVTNWADYAGGAASIEHDICGSCMAAKGNVWNR